MKQTGPSLLHDRLPRTAAVLEEGLAAGLHPGAQVYVSLRGQVVADAAVGESRPGVAMTPDTLVLWMSMGKPVTAILIARLVDAGHLDVDEPAARVIPEFARGGKEAVTVAHLLTHTGGFRNVGSNWSSLPWEEMIARICAAPLEEGWIVGQTGGYHVASSWYILAEVARRTYARIEGQPLHPPAIYRREIFQPLGMTDCWIGMPRHTWIDYGTRVGLMFDTSKLADRGLRPAAFPNSELGSTLCRPGGNGRGPMRELGRFYEQLLADRGDLGAEATERRSDEATKGAEATERRSEEATEGVEATKRRSDEATKGVEATERRSDEATKGEQGRASSGSGPPSLRRSVASSLSPRSPLLYPETARRFTSRQRAGQIDRTFNSRLDWGYGFHVNLPEGERHTRTPYGFGPHASPDAFGHSGNQSSCAFADPAHGLVACWATNGMPGELAHQRRHRAINTAIYEDLGLA